MQQLSSGSRTGNSGSLDPNFDPSGSSTGPLGLARVVTVKSGQLTGQSGQRPPLILFENPDTGKSQALAALATTFGADLHTAGQLTVRRTLYLSLSDVSLSLVVVTSCGHPR